MGTPFEGSAAVRCHLVQALRADLIGPFDAAGEELLSLPPSRWYLLGFLAPEAAREPEDPTADDELGAGDDDDDDDTATREPEVKRRHRLPASMGLSVLLPSGPPDGAADAVEVTLSYADYVPVPREETADPGQDDAARVLWRRVPRSPVVLSVPLDARRLAAGVEVPESKGLRLQGQLLPAAAPGLPAGTRALSLFLINGRDPGDPRARDAAFVFQVQLALAYPGGLVPRPNLRDAEAVDFDDRVADLQYRGRFEVAVGHNVATETFALPGGGLGARTAWLPEATVPRIVTREVPEVETRMDTLAALAEGADAGGLQAALRGLPEAYGLWIAAQREVWLGPPGSPRVATQQAVLDRAEAARTRISRGIALLGEDAEVRAAFGLANRAMALAGRRRRDGEPRWYLFQLAFLLLNLPGIADDGDDDRELVELIFFPTGGGKTEAYFGVIAFLLVLRRLRGQRRPDGGLGVAVLLRYTLRLLTLDQLGRAATLICALETLRRADRPKSAKSADSADSADSGRLGAVRWTVGLWVGRSATANTLAEVARQVLDYKNDRGASPCPLTECPWCRRPLDKDSLTLVSRGRATEDLVEVVVACTSFQCEFSAGRNPEGLPVLFVDEQIYRELPSFLVATVDKFAMLPWRGEAGLLLGRGVEARVGRGFLSPGGPGEARGGKLPAGAVALPAGLLPPELIVQDELHLIAGPLGTMAGLYETAVETLCSRRGEDGRVRRPKVMASTATVRRSGEQIRALFGRHRMALFPPPGIDEGETFFARCDPGHPGRVYVGVAAPGRPMKAVLLRTYVTLLAAAEHAFARDGGTGAAAADPYMTLAGYFNSLRELGGMRRLVEDEVYSRTSRAEERRPFQALGQRQPQQGQRPEAPAGPHPWLRSRAIRQEPIELTSRETTALIKEHKSRLEVPHQAGRRSVDVVLATNMISVGVDIDRLGLMVVAGQPKSTSEYIQASSRVGRDPRWPGLVVTVLNLHKPRDRSHYERFVAYHECFYRFVEPASLTPFSGPALDRGLAAVLVAMARHGRPALMPPAGMMRIAEHLEAGEAAVRALAERAGRERALLPEEQARVMSLLEARGRELLAAWRGLADAARTAGGARCYSPFDPGRQGKPLLYTVLDAEEVEAGSDEARFAAPTSMRDVEPVVHLWRERRVLPGPEGRERARAGDNAAAEAEAGDAAQAEARSQGQGDSDGG